jgi:hypothetical protein
MILRTNLNTSPYFADYNPTDDYYQILFQPGVSVQTRELNNLQLMFQKQLERFGDNIFQSGTIVSGCNFGFNNPSPYIKIEDLTAEGNSAVPQQYVNYNLVNEVTHLAAWVVSFKDGFQATDPDLKTLYVNYQNTGNTTSNTLTFSAGDVLKAYDPIMNGIESVIVNNGGLGFSNVDSVIAVSPFIVSVTSGALTVGDNLINNLGANVTITAVDANTYASSNQVILQVKPRSSDLANSAVNTPAWTVQVGQSLTNPSNTVAAQVNQIIGTGFRGAVITDGVGTVQQVRINDKGNGYTTSLVPYITVRSLNNTTGYSTLDLLAKNYLTKLTVASTPSSVGNGYSFTIGEGVVYQKGYFLRVIPQTIIVAKYTQFPDNVAVGFTTTEQIINSNIDLKLLDNVANTSNEQAPGADRIRLIPSLQVATVAQASANAEFLTIVEWKEGKPYKQNQSTSYSIIGDEMARRTDEQSGDFVIDPFLVTTRSPLIANDEGEFFNVVIDPGKAYIDGYRVSTTSNFNIDSEKGTDTLKTGNHAVSLNYGNWVPINNVAGTFQFNTGDTVDLYDVPRGFLASTALIRAQTLLPSGNKIGTANIRSMMLKDNRPGTAGAVYKLYLFNIRMLGTKNFRDVRSVYYNGAARKGIGDIVTVIDPTTGVPMAQLYDVQTNRMTFDIGIETLFNANDVSYLYRTIDQTVSISNGNSTNATLIKDISGTPNEYFPYTGNLSATNLSDLIVIPSGAELVAVTGAAGTVSANGTSPIITGTASTFLTDFAVGDWVYVTANSTGGGDLHAIGTIVNNTYLTLDSNVAYVNATAKLFRAFPQNVPIPFGDRSGLTGKVDVNQNILTLDFGMPFTFIGTPKTASLACNINRVAPTQSTKTPMRNRFIRVACSNSEGNTVGPWCVGVPDVFRLRGVYVGNSTVSEINSPNQIKNFYIDHNQTSNYYDLSWLYLTPRASIGLNPTDYILVQFDYFTATGSGFYDTVSYTHTANLAQLLIQDSQPLSNLVSVVNTFEIPEMFTDEGLEIDLLNQFDFRPVVANTVNPSILSSGAPVNPSSVMNLGVTGEKRFPAPDSLFTADIEFFLGRMDGVYVDKQGKFLTLQGSPSQFKEKRTRPTTPDTALKIIDLVIPPYPNLPTYYSNQLDEIIETNVMNQKYLTTRINIKTISTPTSNNVLPYNQPKVYTMADIGNLERRIKDVEYISALTAMESGLSHAFIPSSVDPSLDRFKFGFFVDDFSTTIFSDLTNPQYWALREAPDIVPPKMTWDVTLIGGTPTYIDSAIVEQLISTLGSVEDPLGLGPVCALNMANTVAYLTMFRNAQDILKTANPTGVTDVVNLTFASNTTIYDTFNYVDTPLNEYLLTHQFDQFKNFSLAANYLVNIVDPMFSGLSGSVQDLQNFMATWGANMQWDLRVVDQGTFDAVSALFNQYIGTGQTFGFGVGDQHMGLPSTAHSFPEFVSYLINIIQQAQVAPVAKPSGGQFVSEIYYPPVVLYFYNYDKPNKIEIFQNNTLVMDSGSAVPLTPEDVNLLVGAGGKQWFDDDTQYFLKPPVQQGGGYVTYAGKMNWTYNPAGGNQITIKATSPHSMRWRYVVAYPIDGKSVGCIPPNRTYNIGSQYDPNYQNVNIVNWCGNGRVLGVGQVSILTGYTESWAPFAIPAAKTSVIPFDISANWYHGGQG